MSQSYINVIGAGLAGSEAAYQIAQQGIPVKLYEMRGVKSTPQHKTDNFAELVCSNSLRGDSLTLSLIHIFPISQTSIIKGDANSLSIAAASIVAKVTRDQMMAAYNQEYPGYDFAQNAGYGTSNHLEGLEKHGVTPIHRRSFEPIKSMTDVD